MRGLLLGALAALVLAGCGGKDAISQSDAEAIAALSQDADKHFSAFSEAIRTLSTEDKCSSDHMRDYGGFMRASGEPYYFIYCGEPEGASRRWYLDPYTGELTRYSAEL